MILYGERDYSLLLEKKIPREIFNIINSLYEETKIRVNFFDGLSKPFLSARGVLQGDVLSPLMFNIYINGIVETLQDENFDPMLIGNTSINTLLYARMIWFYCQVAHKGYRIALKNFLSFVLIGNWRSIYPNQKH